MFFFSYDFHTLTSKEETIITYKPSIEKKYLGLKTQGHNFASENKKVVTINQYLCRIIKITIHPLFYRTKTFCLIM